MQTKHVVTAPPVTVYYTTFIDSWGMVLRVVAYLRHCST